MAHAVIFEEFSPRVTQRFPLYATERKHHGFNSGSSTKQLTVFAQAGQSI